MSTHSIKVADGEVEVAEIGDGTPVLYLHGIIDLHGLVPEPMAFHRALAETCRVIAPAHPGCANTSDDETLESVEDVVFHYLRVLDALKLDNPVLAGSGIGGWIAAELAVRHPDRFKKLVLLGPTGLFVSGHPIGDVFLYAQPDDGLRYDNLRNLLFAGPRTETGMMLIPDAKDDIEREMLKYKMFRFASLIGFKPPYLYHPRLRSRLDRYRNPALILAGEDDDLVPHAHMEAYADGLPNSALETVAGCGNSLIAEDPDGVAGRVAAFVNA